MADGYLGQQPTGCDEEAALACEQEFLTCQLFSGPANDKETLCTCASVYYGLCLRKAGVSNVLLAISQSSTYLNIQ
jgi:hypothetical protein